MTKTTSINSLFLVFGVPILLIFTIIFFSQTHFFTSNVKMMSLAMTLDLLLSVPLIYYLLIRKKNIAKTTVVPVFILGIIIASFVIPKENQFILQLVKTWVLPIVELGVLSYISFKVYKSIQIFRLKKDTSVDFFTVLKNTCNEIVPGRMAAALSTEIGVIYYGFVNWKKYILKPNEFSYHKNSGTIALIGGFIFAVFIETVAFHLLIAKWNNTVAWVLTGLSIYSAIQLFGLLKSISRRPIVIEKDIIHLRYGIFNETSIPIKDIETIEMTSKTIEFDKEKRKFSLFGDIEGHNVVINLKKENTINGFYGFNKNYKTVAFFVDEKEAFKTKIESLLNQ